MKKKTYVWHGALLGLAAAAFAAGCGGSPGSDPSTEASSSEAAIVALGAPVISGCGLSLAFDIAAPSPLGFIGVQNLSAFNKNLASNTAAQSASSAMNNMELVLWQVDQFGQVTQVNQQATQASNSMMAMLDQFASNSALAQQSNSGFVNSASSVNQFAATNRDYAAATTTSMVGSEILDSYTNNTYAASHNASAYNAAQNAASAANNVAASNFNSASANNAFNASNFAKQLTAQEAAIFTNNFFNNSSIAATPIVTPFLFGGLNPSVFSSALASAGTVEQSSAIADQIVAANQNSAMAANQASATQASQATNAFNSAANESAVASNDFVSNTTDTHLARAVNQTNTVATTEHLAESTALSADQINSSAFANNATALNQATSANSVNQSASSWAQQNTWAFSDLSNLNSNHYILQVNVNAFNEQAAFQVFTGLNDNIVANTAFNQSLPGCF